MSFYITLATSILWLATFPQTTLSFTPPLRHPFAPALKTLTFQDSTKRTSRCDTALFLSVDPMDDISEQLAKAKELLAKSKAKLAASAEAEASIPHFAAAATPASNKDVPKADRSSVIKSRDPESGLITTDGDKMAELSESEEWESRRLMDLFQWEEGEITISRQEEIELMSKEKNSIMAMFGLRRVLQDKDFKRVFDSRNRFIGETE